MKNLYKVILDNTGFVDLPKSVKVASIGMHHVSSIVRDWCDKNGYTKTDNLNNPNIKTMPTILSIIYKGKVIE